MPKVLCPRHEENTPSVEVYADGGYCYGCGQQIPLAELERMGPLPPPEEKFVEDLAERRAYIETLPVKEIRGFPLHYDDLGYYLLWPDSHYYKRRNWDDAVRYKSPSGHREPLFYASRGAHTRLWVVEGQFNALSLALAFPNDDVVSPGSASNFKKLDLTSVLTFIWHYRTIVVVVDEDAPGADAAIHLKGLLVNRVPEVRVVLMAQDANAVHCGAGIEVLRETVNQGLLKNL